MLEHELVSEVKQQSLLSPHPLRRDPDKRGGKDKSDSQLVLIFQDAKKGIGK